MKTPLIARCAGQFPRLACRQPKSSRENIMAVGVVATLKVAEGKGSDFEAVFRDLAAQVKANEAGNEMYRVFKSKADANTYVVMEIYADQAALEAHGKSDHFRAAGPRIAPTLAGRPEIQYFDSI
jgi:quinol monooxygenase YgiN